MAERADINEEQQPKRVGARLVALLVGLVLALCAVAALAIVLPAQGECDSGLEYGYVYSGPKSSSVDFVKAASDERSLYVFGSSEFSTPASTVPQVPAGLFATHDYGVHLQLIGEAYDQSLWHTMAIGAHAAKGMPQSKVVLIVAPGWFGDGGMDPETFKTRFSYSLYRGFCENEDIPDTTKEYVADRLIELGVDENTVRSARGLLPQDFVNKAALSFMDDLRLRRELADARSHGVPLMRSDEPESPDFLELYKKALSDAHARSTNEWGIADSFYDKQLAPVLSKSKNARADETYTDTPEYTDLSCALDVANACDLDTLVVISPVLGPYYDLIGIDKQKRERCYQRIREMCEQHGVEVADFSDKEYDKFFLCDIVHFGWTGWVDVEQAIYEFAQQEDQ